MKPWKTVERRRILNHSKYLAVESHTVELPDGRRIKNWPWLVLPDFVLVVPRTAGGRFLCFRQVKYAIRGTSLAPVGGHIERGEKPLPAAKRELREEMGYAARRWVRLGEFVTDSNRGGARAHLYLALDAHRVGEPRSDDLEEQHLLTLSRRELEDALLGGQFKGLSWTTAVAMALQYLCAHRRHRIALRR